LPPANLTYLIPSIVYIRLFVWVSMTRRQFSLYRRAFLPKHAWTPCTTLENDGRRLLKKTKKKKKKRLQSQRRILCPHIRDVNQKKEKLLYVAVVEATT
jgi:hypothetical protein